MAANLLDLAALRQSLTRLRTKLNGKADSTALAAKADKSLATTSADGLMSKADKAALDSLVNGGGTGGTGDGIYYTPSMDANGNLSWTNNGGLPNPSTVNVRGPAGQNGTNGAPGANGQDGAPGQAATVEIGTVTVGNTASVTNSGTATAAVLDFVLPQGGGGGGEGGLTQEQVQAIVNRALSANGLQEYIDVGGDNEVDAQFLRDLRTVIYNATGVTVDVSDAGIPTLAENIRLALSAVVSQNNEAVATWNPSATIDIRNINSLAIGQGNGGLITIADGAFNTGDPGFGGVRLTKMKRVSLPETVSIIGEAAFQGNGLEEIIVPAGTTIVKKDAFRDCESLTRAVLNGGIYEEGVFAGCTHLGTVTAASSVNFSGKDMFKDDSILESVQVPTATTMIREQFCRECVRLTSVTLHSGITTIENAAFYRCLVLPSFNFALLTNLVEIGEDAFYECERLNFNLSGCTSLKTIKDRAFKNCKAVRAMSIPNSVEDVKANAFESCVELQTLVIGTGALYVRDNAFLNCTQLSNVTINANSLSLFEHPFRGCTNLTSFGPTGGNYTIKAAWTDNVPDDAFNDMQYLTTAVIPSGITVVGERAFQNCHNLTSVTIPASVEVIKSDAFSGCNNLNSLTFQGSVGSIRIEGGAFNDVPASNAPDSNA